MSKTADEILESVYSRTRFAYSIPDEKDTIEAMREFAAQEIDAYKERLKSVLFERFPNMIWLPKEVNSIIDTVK